MTDYAKHIETMQFMRRFKMNELHWPAMDAAMELMRAATPKDEQAERAHCSRAGERLGARPLETWLASERAAARAEGIDIGFARGEASMALKSVTTAGELAAAKAELSLARDQLAGNAGTIEALTAMRRAGEGTTVNAWCAGVLAAEVRRLQRDLDLFRDAGEAAELRVVQLREGLVQLDLALKARATMHDADQVTLEQIEQVCTRYGYEAASGQLVCEWIDETLGEKKP